jgi:transposase
MKSIGYAKITDDSIGIDISKDKLDCHRLSDGACRQFPNTAQGFQRLRGWIGQTPPARVVYEPTGAYHGAFEAALADHLPLVKVTPRHARRFAESRGQLAKTDRADARVLAQIGRAHGLEPDQPAARDRPVLRELQAARTALVKDKVRLQNQLDRQTLRRTRKMTRRRLRQATADIAALDQAIREQLKTCPKRRRALHLIQSIKGLG